MARSSRRDVIKTGALAGAAAVSGPLLDRLAFGRPNPSRIDIAAVQGGTPFEGARRAVEVLGGIGKFVPRGASVGLLINAPKWWNKPGSYTHPEVALAAITLCLDAGARQVTYLLDPAEDYWDRTPLAATHKAAIQSVKRCSGRYIEKAVPAGKTLKKVNIIQELFDCTTFINLPIFKSHTGTLMTGNLKNHMGANADASNRFFHSGGGRSGYENVPFLSQCIADLNTLRRPDLCLGDATEFLLTGGPEGPGQIRRLRTVVAGTDPVAMDALGATFLDLAPANILMLKMAEDHGLGRSDLSRVAVRQVTL